MGHCQKSNPPGKTMIFRFYPMYQNYHLCKMECTRFFNPLILVPGLPLLKNLNLNPYL